MVMDHGNDGYETGVVIVSAERADATHTALQDARVGTIYSWALDGCHYLDDCHLNERSPVAIPFGYDTAIDFSLVIEDLVRTLASERGYFQVKFYGCE